MIGINKDGFLTIKFMNINFSIIPEIHLTYVSSTSITFKLLVEYFSVPDIVTHKMNAPLFNGCSYLDISEISNRTNVVTIDDKTCLPRRIKNNLSSMHMLVLDYDKGLSIAEAKKQLKGLHCFLYTSFSHAPDNPRFRVLLPLKTPIPLKYYEINPNVWVNGLLPQLTPALQNTFPECDPSSFKPNQFFFVSSCLQESSQYFETWLNEGELFDWEVLPLASLAEVSHNQQQQYTTKDALVASRRHIKPDDYIQTNQGSIRAGDVTKRVQGVKCPFHSDRKGSEFMNVSGRIYLHCKRCAETYYVYDEDDPLPNKSRAEIFSGLVFDDDGYEYERDFKDASNRESINKQLEEIYKSITGHNSYFMGKYGRIYHAHVIYLPEGSGKSSLVKHLARDGHKVVFATKSYKQAVEQAEQFRLDGIQHEYDVKVIKSFSGIIQEKYGVKPIRNKTTNPYALGAIDEEATIALILQQHPDKNEEMLRLTFEFIGNDTYEPHQNTGEDELPVNIEIMTQTMLRILPTIHKMPNNTYTIVIDDPDASDIIDISPVPPNVKLEDLESENITKRKSGKFYYQRDPKQSIEHGYSFHQLIYTTTEKTTIALIKDRHRRYSKQKLITHEKMHDVFGGKITILGTAMVRKSNDGLIPVIFKHIQKSHGKGLVLIADGLASKHNHSNTKGQNSLTTVDSILEISIPHPDAVNTVCDWLNENFQAVGKKITIDLMLDKLHQGLGRNSGYRGRDQEAVALVDPMYHAIITKSCRYMLNMKDCVIVDRLQSMSRLDKRLSDTASPLVLQLEKYINHPDELFCDFRLAKPAIRAVIKEIDESDKLIAYLARLITGIGSVAKIDILNLNQLKLNTTQKKYVSLIEWIFDEFTNEFTKNKVITLLKNEVEEKLRQSETKKSTVIAIK
jgi:hypothetical protein